MVDRPIFYRRRWVRWIAGIGVAGLALPIATWAFLRTDAGNASIAHGVEHLVQRAMSAGTFHLGGLTTDLESTVCAVGARIEDERGNTIVRVDRLCIDGDLIGVVRSAAARTGYGAAPAAKLAAIRLDGAALDLHQSADGTLDLARLFGIDPNAPSTPWTGLPVDLVVDRIAMNRVAISYQSPDSTLRGQLDTVSTALTSTGTTLRWMQTHAEGRVDARFKTSFRLNAAGRYDGDRLDLDTLAFDDATSSTDATLAIRGNLHLSGLTSKPRVLAQFSTPSTSLDAVERAIGADLGVRGLLSGSVSATGPLDAMAVTAQLGIPGEPSSIDAAATLDVAHAPLNWSGGLTAHRVALDDWLDAVQPSVLVDGTFRGDGAGVAWPHDLVIRGRFEGSEQHIGTEKVDSISAELELKRGAVSFKNLRVIHAAGRTTGSGSFDLIGGTLDTAFVIDNARLSTIGQTWNIEKLKPMNGTATVRGRVTGRPSAEGSPLDIEGTWSITDFGAQGVHVTSAAGPFTLMLDGGSTSLKTTFKTTSSQFPGGFIATEGTGELEYTDGSRGNLDLALRLDNAERRMLDLAANLTWDAAAKTEFRARVERLVVAPIPRQRWALATPATIRWDDDTLEAHINLGSDRGQLRFDGTLATRGALDATIIANHFDLGALPELDHETFSGLWGTVDADARITGTGRLPALRGRVRGDHLWLPGISRWLDVDGTFEADSRSIRLGSAIAVAGQPLGRLDATVPVRLSSAGAALDPDGALDAAFAISPGSIQRLEWLADADLGLPDGRVSAVLRAEGPLGDPDLRTAGVVEVALPGWTDPGRVEFQLARAQNRLTGWADLREGLAARGEVRLEAATHLGRVFGWALRGGSSPDFSDPALYADDLDVRIAALGVPVTSLTALVGDSGRLEGRLIGDVRVTGSPTNPAVAGVFDWKEAKIGDQPLTSATLSLAPADGSYGLDTVFHFPDGGTAQIRGTVDPRGDTALDLEVDLQKIPLQSLSAIDPTLRASEGTFDVRGRVRGPFTAPDPSLTVTSEGAAIDAAPLNVRAHDISLDAEIRGTTLQLRRFTARTRPIEATRFDLAEGLEEAARRASEKPNIEARGTANWDDTPRVELTANFRNALAIDQRERRLEFSGPLRVAGAWPGLAVTGQFKVDRASYTYSSSDLGLGAPTTLAEDIRIHREQTPPPPTAPAATSWIDALRVDVGIDVTRSAEIRASIPIIDDYGSLGAMATRADVVARLSGDDLRVTMTDGQISVIHDIRLVDGQVSVLRTTMKIADGIVRFVGDAENPLLDLTATSQHASGPIAVHITGTPTRPTVDFTSEAYDQTDILTILVTGQSPEELSNTEGSGTWNSLISSLLVNSMFGGASSGSLRYDPDGNLRYRVPVSRNLYAEVTLNPLPDDDENAFGAAVEATLFGDVSAEGSFGDKHDRVDVYWQKRF